jgi:hypothetical protein
MKHALQIGAIMGIMSLLFGCGKPQKPPATQTINPDDLLYSLATLCDELPALDQQSPVPAGTPDMHEDSWRQVEFVSSKNHKELDGKMTEFIAFRNAHRKGLGFTGVFVRKDTYPAIESVAITTSRLGGHLLPLAVSGQRVRGGFSIRDQNGAYLYGQAKPDGTIIHLGLEPPLNGIVSDDFRQAITSVASQNGLILVDWYKGAIVEQLNDAAIRQWGELYKRAEPTHP